MKLLIFLVLCHLTLSFGFGFRPPRRLEMERTIIPNWLLQSMDLPKLVQGRIDNSGPFHTFNFGGKIQAIHDSPDDIIRRIDVLTKTVEEALQSKPFLRIYSK